MPLKTPIEAMLQLLWRQACERRGHPSISRTEVGHQMTWSEALWFPRIRNSEKQQSLQRFHIALDDENLLLLQLLLQSFFESRQELSRFLRVGRQHAVDNDGITIGDACHRPEAFIGLGKEGEAAKLTEKLLLQSLKLLRFNRSAVVVIQRNKEIIFFHQSRLPPGLERWTPGSIR